MGAWGHRSFENDDALDLVWSVEEQGIGAIEVALKGALIPPGDYLEAPEASAAIAAAEFVAAKKTGNADRLQGENIKLLDSFDVSPKLIADSKAAVGRVLQNSELRELWTEADDFSAWHDDVLLLLERLQ
ncbi:MAG: DUF4259 domain-containing protein [Pseudomonadota bacterium]